MKKPYIIGIGGGRASGKTTFAEALAEALSDMKVTVIHMDAYQKKSEERPVSNALVGNKSYTDDNHPDAVKLSRLAQDIAEESITCESQVIIVEGPLTLWYEPILKQLDLKLFFDCRADERALRILKRGQRWSKNMDKEAEAYLELARYRHDEYVEPTRWRADMILNGAYSSDNALAMVAEFVKRNVE